LDAAVLLEAGWHSLCNAVVFVDVPEEQRFDRVAACRGWTEQEFGCREASQWPIPQKRQRADFVIPNSDHRIEEAGAALDRILRRLIEKNG